MNERVEMEIAKDLADLRARVKRLEDDRAAEREARAKDISIWKASGIGVGFTLLVQFLRWWWHTHVK